MGGAGAGRGRRGVWEGGERSKVTTPVAFDPITVSAPLEPCSPATTLCAFTVISQADTSQAATRESSPVAFVRNELILISRSSSRMATTLGAQVTSDPEHIQYMLLALAEAKKCVATPTAFCVGAILVSPSSASPPRVLATGYSRELPGNTHAEQCAIDKFLSSQSDPVAGAALLVGASLYTTMEPCSLRLSGNVPCVERVIAAGLGRVYMGVSEPRDFVECEGTRKLEDSGAQVWVVEAAGLRAACLHEARRAHDGGARSNESSA